MSIDPAQLNELIRNRRSVYPKMYTDEPISRELLEVILENALWAPTHKMTQPWRFQVFQGESRTILSDYLADVYLEKTPKEKFSEVKFKKVKSKPLQSAAVIAICMKRDPEERIPEWEEITATAMAVQNMWLTCTANNIGCYWSSPSAMTAGPAFLELEAGERCLGLLYMGHYEPYEVNPQRVSKEQIVKWR